MTARAWVRRVLWGAVAVSAVLFVLRGPARGLGLPQDLSLIYAEARLWLLGGDPYDAEAAAAAYRAAGGGGEPLVMRGEDQLLLYPPPGLAALSPLGALPWRWAVVSWAVVGVLAWVLALWAAGRVAGLGRGDARWPALLALGLAFAAAHTSIALGQTALPVVGLLAVGGVCLARGSAGAAGVLWGLAAAVKPQLALPFLAYGLVVGRWRFALPGGAVLGGLVVAGAGRLWVAGVDWLPELRANLAAFTHGGHGDPTRAGPHWEQILNVPMLVHGLTDARAVATAAAWGVALAVAAAYFVRGRGASWPSRLPRDLAVLAVVTMLPFYHRYYDAAVLVFVLALAVRWLTAGRWRWGVALLVGLAPVLVPLPAMLSLAAARGVVPEVLAGGWVWDALLVPLQVWAMLLVGVVLLAVPFGRSMPQSDG